MSTHQSYNHRKYEKRRKFLRFLLKYIGFGLLVKLDEVQGLENIPMQGPAILMINHIAFVDPMVAMHVSPRHIVPMAKDEVYSYPVIGVIPKMWHVIPVDRSGADRRAIKQALTVLKAGEIILIAPEGTRSGAMQKVKEGAAYISSRSGAPIIPVAMDRTDGFPTLRFTKRWRKPGAKIVFGKPIQYKPELMRAKGEILEKMADEAMYCLATLLPENRRGYYSDLDKRTTDTLIAF